MNVYRRPDSLRSVLQVCVGPLWQLQSYKHIVYLILAFPIGFFYAMILGFGFIFGIGLSFVLIGLVILALMLVVLRIFTRFERWLSVKLLPVELAASNTAAQTDGSVATIRRYVEDSSTWRGLGFVYLKFWLGIVGLLLVFGLSTAFSMVRSFISRPTTVEFGEVNGEPVVWTIETLPEAGFAALLGVVIVVVMVHVANLFGYVAGRMSLALLQ